MRTDANGASSQLAEDKTVSEVRVVTGSFDLARTVEPSWASFFPNVFGFRIPARLIPLEHEVCSQNTVHVVAIIVSAKNLTCTVTSCVSDPPIVRTAEGWHRKSLIVGTAACATIGDGGERSLYSQLETATGGKSRAIQLAARRNNSQVGAACVPNADRNPYTPPAGSAPVSAERERPRDAARGRQ
jgi:hypothetical protein